MNTFHLTHGNQKPQIDQENSSYEYDGRNILWNEWDIIGSPYEQCERFIATNIINATNHVGITVLQSAIMHNAGHDIVALLLENGADVRVKDMKGITVLQSAIMHNAGHDIVALLLENGADVRVKDMKGETAILYAKKYNACKKVRSLLQKATKSLGISPLHIAMMVHLEPQRVKNILKLNVEIDALDNQKKTPLHYAFIYKTSLEVVTLLLENGANPNAMDINQMIPFQYADDESKLVKFIRENISKNNNPFSMIGFRKAMNEDPAFKFYG